MGSSLATVRAQMKAAAANVTGGGYTLTAARIVLGLDLLSTSNTFLPSLRSSGPYLNILPGQLSDDNPNKEMRMYDVDCNLYFGLNREADATFENEENLLEALRAKWKTPNCFSGVPYAVTVGWDMPKFNKRDDPIRCVYSIHVQIAGYG